MRKCSRLKILYFKLQFFVSFCCRKNVFNQPKMTLNRSRWCIVAFQTSERLDIKELFTWGLLSNWKRWVDMWSNLFVWHKRKSQYIEIFWDTQSSKLNFYFTIPIFLTQSVSYNFTISNNFFCSTQYIKIKFSIRKIYARLDIAFTTFLDDNDLLSDVSFAAQPVIFLGRLP